MQDAADHTTVVHTILAPYVCRQMRLDLTPLFIAQPKQIAPHRLCSESIVQSESATDSTGNAFIGF
jgi:hypothetical protein